MPEITYLCKYMGLKKLIKQLLFLHEFSAEKELGIKHYHPAKEELESLRKSLVENYFSKFPKPFPVHDREQVEKGFIWMDDHMKLRLEAFRQKYVPFLNSVKPLRGSTVMDVGCGTGASLVALAEAGANVYGIDIDTGSLEVAKKRCEIYKTNAEAHLFAAPDIMKFKPGVQFDFIIFNASLEHMYLHERLASLKAAWDRLSPGGFLSIIECPNRLWYFDYHTADLPFFEWLPHDLALMYTRFSPRKFINDLYKLPDNAELMENFIRIGRGMSYHEVDLAIKPNKELNVVETLSNFVYSGSNWLEKSRIRKKTDSGYIKFIQQKSGIGIHQGWCENWLNLAIKKD